MKVTTKRGDRGVTQFKPGKDVSKSDVRIVFVGVVDELQVSIGGISFSDDKINRQLKWIQKKLFDIYSGKVSSEDADKLERWMKEIHDNSEINFDWNLTTPKTFNIDFARVVARKLERVYHAMPESEKSGDTSMFLNRLSDYLWSVARKMESIPVREGS